MRTMTEREATKLFEEFLDEVYPEYEIAGMTYAASDVLKNVDPTAFNCMFADWTDSEQIEIED